jgi:hypothetical protein
MMCGIDDTNLSRRPGTRLMEAHLLTEVERNGEPVFTTTLHGALVSGLTERRVRDRVQQMTKKR